MNKTTDYLLQQIKIRNRYVVSFKTINQPWFVADSAFPTVDGALRYVKTVMETLSVVTEASIWDEETKEQILPA